MELLLVRRFNVNKGPKEEQQYCIGSLFCGNIKICETIEDYDRGLDDSMSLAEISKIKIHGRTAIPTGRYEVDVHSISPRFQSRSWAKTFGGCVPLIKDTKGYEGVRIHPGNKSTDLEGCIAPGENKVVGQVINSQKWYKKLMTDLFNLKEKVYITISRQY